MQCGTRFGEELQPTSRRRRGTSLITHKSGASYVRMRRYTLFGAALDGPDRKETGSRIASLTDFQGCL